MTRINATACDTAKPSGPPPSRRPALPYCIQNVLPLILQKGLMRRHLTSRGASPRGHGGTSGLSPAVPLGQSTEAPPTGRVCARGVGPDRVGSNRASAGAGRTRSVEMSRGHGERGVLVERRLGPRLSSAPAVPCSQVPRRPPVCPSFLSDLLSCLCPSLTVLWPECVLLAVSYLGVFVPAAPSARPPSPEASGVHKVSPLGPLLNITAPPVLSAPAVLSSVATTPSSVLCTYSFIALGVCLHVQCESRTGRRFHTCPALC